MESVNEAKVSAARRAQIDDIKSQKLARQFPGFLYALIDPDEDVIRYIGICTNPIGRYRSHTGAPRPGKSLPPLAKWVAELKALGKLPRMQLLVRFGTYGNWSEQIVHPGTTAKAVEKRVVQGLIQGNYVGNVRHQVDLLNVTYAPQNFLSDGIDAGKDRT